MHTTQRFLALGALLGSLFEISLHLFFPLPNCLVIVLGILSIKVDLRIAGCSFEVVEKSYVIIKLCGK